uniref:ubiquitinyl hydrolase 1 n=1 Tax=Syphacia muris TaxID=451379 RepID=A0A0N5AJK6_9BILA
MLLPKVLTELQYDGWEKLEAKSALPVNEQLKKLTSSRAFTHVEKLYDEAELKRKSGDEEQAYILFSRMCEIAKMITKKSDFKRFKETPDCRLLHDYFKKSISHLDELQASLTKRYKLKKEIEGINTTVNPTKSGDEIKTGSNIDNDLLVFLDFGLIIHPRDLVRAINNDKKVLFIDYRGDCSSLLKYECPGKVFLARVPPSAIIPGCISSTLIHSAEISERVTLQRMSDVDIVVLVGTETPVLENETLKKGTIEHMLFEGLHTYNNNFRLRRAPVFLDGGFNNWALHYPMHTKVKAGAVEDLFINDGENKFLKNVAEYKQRINICFYLIFDLRSVEYPDLLRRPRKNLKAGNLVEKDNTSSSLSTAAKGKSLDFPKLVDDEKTCDSTGHSVAFGATNMRYSESDMGSRTSSKKVDYSKNKGFEPERTAINDSVQSDVDVKNDQASLSPYNQNTKPHAQITAPSRPIVDRTTKPRVFLGQQETPKNVELRKPSNVPHRPFTPPNTMEARGGAQIGPDTKDPLCDLYKAALLEIAEEAIKNKVTLGYTGLRNLRNTCYMNATLQALFNTVPLRNIFDSVAFLKFINRSNSKGTLGVCSATFAALMSAVWSGNYSVIIPSVFRNVFVREVNRDFNDYEQHDAQEFQIFLLAALHEDMDQVHNPVTFQQDYTGQNLQQEVLDFERNWRMYTNSPVNDIFRSITLSVKRCKTCGRESASFEEITQLSIAISQTSLVGCIAAHFERIELEGDSKWMCPKCKVYRDASLKTDIWSPPQILVVHLKRSTDGINKNDSLVEFDTGTLDLKYCIHSQANSASSTYKLYAIINHIGSLTSGHYTAFVQNLQPNGSKQWIVCDDEVIRPISEDSLCTRNAVVLYFQKC